MQIERKRMVRTAFLVPIALIGSVLLVAMLSSVRSLSDLGYMLGGGAMIGSFPAMMWILKRLSPHPEAVCEGGLLVRQRGQLRLLPWAKVDCVKLVRIRTQQGYTTRMYYFGSGPDAARLSPDLYGNDFVQQVITEVCRRAGLVPDGQGNAVRRAASTG